MGYQSRLRTQVQNWTTVLSRSGLIWRLLVPSHAKERKSMTGRSSLEYSGITPFSGVPLDLDLRISDSSETREFSKFVLTFLVNASNVVKSLSLQFLWFRASLRALPGCLDNRLSTGQFFCCCYEVKDSGLALGKAECCEWQLSNLVTYCRIIHYGNNKLPTLRVKTKFGQKFTFYFLSF